MKNAKQIVFILIGTAMILLAVGLIIMRRSNDTTKGKQGERQSGSYVFSEPVKSLVFEAGACTIEILEGEGTEYIVDFENLKYGTLETEQNGEELKISYKQNDNWTAKMFMEDDINNQKITLTMPKGAELDSALFEFGAAEISMEDVTAKKLYLTVGAGAAADAASGYCDGEYRSQHRAVS